MTEVLKKLKKNKGTSEKKIPRTSRFRLKIEMKEIITARELSHLHPRHEVLIPDFIRNGHIISNQLRLY